MDGGKLEDLVDPEGRCADPERVKAVAALFNLTLASADQIRQGRELGARLISSQVASADVLHAVQSRTGASQFVHVEEGVVDGALGFAALRATGRDALVEGAFDPRDFALDLIAPPGEPPAAVFAFGVVASTKAGGSAVIGGAAAIQEALFWALPIYTRIATADGERVLLTRLGFRRVQGDTSLACRPPRTRPLEGFSAGAAA
ncbi:MAG TPA: hypothetical protein VG943_00425 [Caulobacterales bacterium]|nr:hypothetical protein [Caulobacterales bacterium]